jgi:predicted O-methyltransferase YrrM
VNDRARLAGGWHVVVGASVVGLIATTLAIVGSWSGLLLLVVAVQLGLLLFVRRLGARIVGRLARTDRRVAEAHAASQSRDDAVAARLEQAEGLVGGLADALEPVREQVPEIAARLEELSDRLAASSKDQVTRSDLRFALRRTYDQMDALQALYHEIRPAHAFPPMGTWAASPDLLRFLLTTILREQPRLIVECGSGVSTLVMAYALERVDGGRVIALEHLEEHHRLTTALVEQHGLAHRVDLRLAPLTDVEVDGVTYPWYDPVALPDQTVDLLLVDGPPGKEHPHARLPALPLFHDRLADDAIVVLDDHRRDEEQEIVRRWQERYPGLSCDEIKHEKGTAVLTWPATMPGG